MKYLVFVIVSIMLFVACASPSVKKRGIPRNSNDCGSITTKEGSEAGEGSEKSAKPVEGSENVAKGAGSEVDCMGGEAGGN
ncbi:MAG: hypothetical protein AAF518_12380 [Spirochaetota bacterium]